MTWNHRVFRRYYDGTDEPYYTVTEVYYNDDGEIYGYIDAEDGKCPWGEDVDELKWVIQRYLEACELPVIDIREIEAYFEERRNQPQEPEGPYEVFNSVEELLAALDSEEDDADSPSGDTPG